MSLKIRRSIFYTLILIFLILAFYIIPYSNGWRFDFGSFSFVKLGGLYLNVEPTEATVRVDKLSFEIKSSFMTSGLLIANLFPKNYRISIQKDGYQSWSKTITIKPSLVTQIYPIIMIPEKTTEKLLKTKVSDFFLNTNYLTWKDTNNKLRIDDKIIKGNKFLAWLTGNKLALVYEEATKNYLVINPAQNNSALNINLLFENLKYQKTVNDKNPIREIAIHPIDKNKLIITTIKNLYVLDFYKPSLAIIKNGQFDLVNASGEEIFFTDSSGLYFYNLSKNDDPLLLQQGKIDAMEISPNNQFIAFSSNNKLTLLDRSKNENNLTVLIDNPTYFKFSPDSKKISVINNNKIKVFFIGDDYELFNKKLMGVSSFEINSIDQNSPIIWHNNSCYMFVKSGTSLQFLEINDDPSINLQTIDTDIDKYFYDKQENLIYLIKKESLYEISL